MKHVLWLRYIALLLAALMLLSAAVWAAPDTPETEQPVEPTPVDTEPAPEETEPAPEETEPTPVETEPAPIETEPAPIETEPEPEPTPEPTPEPRDMTDEQLIERFNIPNTWARPALLFAVRTGLLNGRDGGLCPGENASRGELATMIMRVAGTSAMADLSAYTDTPAGAWYYHSIARAMALGVLQGTSATTTSPNAPVTREQAFVMLARLFGVNARNRYVIYNYSDWKDVSEWAALSMAAMVEAGYVKGNGGKLNPKGLITRQEIAQVFYNLLTDWGRDLPAEFQGSYGLTADTIAPGTVVEGDLLFCTDRGRICLDGVTVTGKLILQGIDTARLELTNCHIGEVVLCRNTVVYTDEHCPAKVTANAPYVDLHGNFDTVDVWDSCLTVKADCTAAEVNLLAPGARVIVEGTVDTVNVLNRGQKVDGTGLVRQLNAHYSLFRLSCAVGNRTNITDPNPEQIRGEAIESVIVTLNSPTSGVAVRIHNLPLPIREYTAEWYVNGKCQASESRLLLQESQVLRANLNFSEVLDVDKPSLTGEYTLVLKTPEGDSVSLSFSADTSDTVARAANTVRTQNVQATVKKTTPLYGYYSLSGNQLGTLTNGTQVTYVTYYTKDGSIYSAYVRTQDGKTGWVKYADISVSWAKYYVTWDYAAPVKEYWINHIKRASSPNQYLVWISLYTQKVNVFQGSKGNWKLIRTCPCSSGTNDRCTKVQDTKILYHTDRWLYEDFYVDHVVGFDNEGRAFHSRLKNYDEEGSLYSAAISYPASHGCIRMLDNDLLFIWSLPIGTTVIVY